MPIEPERRMWTRVSAYVQGISRRRRIDAEVDEELRFHLEHAIAANLSAGQSPAEARRSALQELSGITQTREAVRDVRSIWLDQLWHDVRYGARRLRREPGFSAGTVLALGLAVGAYNTIFTIVNAASLRGLSIVDAERVLFVGSRDERGAEQGVSYLDFQDLQSASRVFQGLAAHVAAPVEIADPERAPDRIFANYVSANALSLLGERPFAGRDFVPEDGQPGAPAVAILGGGVWRSRYGSNLSAIGRTIQVDGVPTAVVGVMREGFKLPNNADIWLPLAQRPGLTGQARDARILTVFGRLAAGVSIVQAGEELNVVASRLSREHPQSNSGIHPVVVPLNDRYNSDVTGFIPFLAIGVVIVLIACSNVGNLLLMRSITRTREIAMRASLGASRWRIVRQLMTESTLLAVLAGVLGLGLSIGAAHLLWAAIPANAVPYWFDYRMDMSVLAALTSVCLMTVFVFGLVPAFQLARTDTGQILKSAGRSSMLGIRGRKWTTAFLAAQFGLATMFVAAMVNAERVSRAVRSSEFSIDVSPLQTMWISLPPQRYGSPAERIAFHRRLHEQIERSPGVLSSTVATALPSGGAVARQMVIDDRADRSGLAPPTVSTISVGPRYFETLGLPLRGDEVTADESNPGSSGVKVVVNQRLASLYFSGDDPIGRRITLSGTNGPAIAATIAGVSATFRQRPAGGAATDPVVYLPVGATAPSNVALIIRGETDTAALLAPVREIVHAIDPDLPIYRNMPMAQAIHEMQWGSRQSVVISYTLIGIALTLAIVGLYAVTAHAVKQRTQELGVRRALGARSGDVMSIVLGRMLRQLSIGLLAGVACTFAWERLFRSVSATPDIAAALRMTDVSVLLLTEVAIIVAALAACFSIARSATRVDPIVALRHE